MAATEPTTRRIGQNHAGNGGAAPRENYADAAAAWAQAKTRLDNAQQAQVDAEKETMVASQDETARWDDLQHISGRGDRPQKAAR